MSGVVPVYGRLHNDGTDWSDTLTQAFCASEKPTEIAPLILAKEFVFPYTKTNLTNELTSLESKKDSEKPSPDNRKKAIDALHQKYAIVESMNEQHIQKLRNKGHFLRGEPYTWIALSGAPLHIAEQNPSTDRILISITFRLSGEFVKYLKEKNLYMALLRDIWKDMVPLKGANKQATNKEPQRTP